MVKPKKPATQWLRVREVAEYLRVSRQWIYIRIMHDEIPYHYAPGSRIPLVDAHEIDRWVKKQPPTRRAKPRKPDGEASEDGRAER